MFVSTSLPDPITGKIAIELTLEQFDAENQLKQREQRYGCYNWHNQRYLHAFTTMHADQVKHRK